MKKLKVFVTVGTGSFDDLVRAVDKLPVTARMQIGSGTYKPENHKYFDLTNDLQKHYRWADVVVAHGGAATTFEVLRLGKPLVSVPNPHRTDKHQEQILHEFSQRKELIYCSNVKQIGKYIRQATKKKKEKYEKPFCEIDTIIDHWLSGPRILAITNMYPTRKSPTNGYFLKRNYDVLRDLGYRVNVISCGTGKRGGFFWWVKYVELLLKTCWKTVTYQYNIVQAHHVFPVGPIATFAAWIKNVPLVTTTHGDDLYQAEKNLLARRLFRFVSKRTTKAICVSNEFKKRYCSLTKKDESSVSVIASGLETDRFFPRSKQEAREKTGLPQDKKIILYAGQFMPVKRVDTLLTSFARLKRNDTLLVLIGKGPLTKTLKQYAKQLGVQHNVLFLPYKSRDVLPWWICAADVFVHPSSDDGIANAVLEAIACDTPVIAARSGGIPEIITHNRNGLLYRPGDVNTLVVYLTTLLNIPSFAKKISRPQTVHKFNMVDMTKKRARLYDTVLKRGRS